MIILSGAHLILPDRLLDPGALVIDGDRIIEVRSGDAPPSGASVLTLTDHYIAPGFIDVHVHGVEGRDALDGGDAIAQIAARLPRYGVTAFCPTTVACPPDALRAVFAAVRAARARPPRGARVLAAHLESNFINPEYKGAQPIACLRLPPSIDAAGRDRASFTARGAPPPLALSDFTADDILREIEAFSPEVGIVTLAPELAGGLDLVAHLAAAGQRVSLGHSAATYDQALEAIGAGARQATHLFNRMPPLDHRAPGLGGAVLASEEVVAEIICDGYHVHPAMVRAAVEAKRPARVMAITDGTAGSGMPVGTTGRLGGQPITVTEHAAFLDDGTLAGSVWTMDRAFRMLIERAGVGPVEAALMCSTTPARELGLHGAGALVAGNQADLVVLNRRFELVQTYVAGRCVYSTIS